MDQKSSGGHIKEPAWSEGALARRLQMLRGDRTYIQVAAMVGMNHESVRRHMLDGRPSAEFLAKLCLAFGCSAEWLLLGLGPMSREELVVYAMEAAKPSELGRALGAMIERLQAGHRSGMADSVEIKPSTNPTSARRSQPSDTNG